MEIILRIYSIAFYHTIHNLLRMLLYFLMNNSFSFMDQDSCSRRVIKLQLPNIIIEKQVAKIEGMHSLFSGSWNPREKQIVTY